MNNNVLDIEDIKSTVKTLLRKYNAEYALLFGSYARGEADSFSDIDIVVFGGDNFRTTDIFSFIQELSKTLGKQVDGYEICEVNKGTPFYNNVMKEGVKIAA